MRNTDLQVGAPSGVYSAVTQSEEQLGESLLGAHATGLCSSCAIKLCPMAISRRRQTLCLLASDLAPDDVFVISTVDKRVDFSVLIVTKQDSSFDTLAE